MENTVVILVHGYNVSDPRKTVGKFRRPFEDLGCLVESYTYGYWPLPIQITRRNPRFAAELAERCLHWKNKGFQVCLAVHSNGAAIARIAREVHRAPIDRLLAVHPALKKELAPCRNAKRVLVVHNRGDKAVLAGGWLGRLSAIVFPKKWESARPWGTMGMVGYSGRSRSVVNIDTASDEFHVRAWGHSDEFSDEKVHYFLPLLAHRLLAE